MPACVEETWRVKSPFDYDRGHLEISVDVGGDEGELVDVVAELGGKVEQAGCV